MLVIPVEGMEADRWISHSGGSIDTEIGKEGQKEIPKGITAWTNLAK